MKYKINPDLAYKVSPIYNQATSLQMNLVFCDQRHNHIYCNGYEVAVQFYCDTLEEIEEIKEIANHILKGDWEIEQEHRLIGDPAEYFYISFSHQIDD